MIKNKFKIPTIKHLTHKSGNFIFSCECDENVIYPLMVEFNTLYKSIQKLPILPSIYTGLEVDLVRLSVFGTAAIEGNPLSEDDVSRILEEDEIEGAVDVQGVKGRAELEIRNLKLLYNILGRIQTDTRIMILDETLKTFQHMITIDINYYNNSPGLYRNEVVKVGDNNHGGVYTPPKTLDDIKTLMSLFVDWINAPKMLEIDPSLRAALAHYHFAMIHPFQDGNGRTARFVEAMVLKNGGVGLAAPMMANFYYRNIDEYFTVFSESRKTKDLTSFLQFYYRGMIESLEEVQRRVINSLNLILFFNYLSHQKETKVITARQHNLVLQVIAVKKEFSLRDLYSDPVLKTLYLDVSESTARRDVKKLIELKIIKETIPKQYTVNWERLKSL